LIKRNELPQIRPMAANSSQSVVANGSRSERVEVTVDAVINERTPRGRRLLHLIVIQDVGLTISVLGWLSTANELA